MNAARMNTLSRVLAVLGITSSEPLAAYDRQLKALDAALDALLTERRDVTAVEAAAEGNTTLLVSALVDARRTISTLEGELASLRDRWARYADDVQNAVAAIPHNGRDCSITTDNPPEECAVCAAETAAATRPEDCEDCCCGCDCSEA